MYIQGFVVPVPHDKKDAYIDLARFVGEIMRDYGALEIMEAWEADVKDGHTTDFRMAVKAQEGEKIVFSWVIWPDKATCDSSHEKMMQDERMQGEFAMPFDGKRMILGGFDPVWTLGR
ncbi:DUF1428 domain-containing protein [Altererythrobacter lauratis]|uniref:DUF1428 domain-containing protein n=1 Tax=Alteraurantiacibacter lauratis TaxID=2054627 RepID=A0ABV7EIY6_9SPHN